MCGNNMSAPLPAIVPAARKATAAVSEAGARAGSAAAPLCWRGGRGRGARRGRLRGMAGGPARPGPGGSVPLLPCRRRAGLGTWKVSGARGERPLMAAGPGRGSERSGVFLGESGAVLRTVPDLGWAPGARGRGAFGCLAILNLYLCCLFFVLFFLFSCFISLRSFFFTD